MATLQHHRADELWLTQRTSHLLRRASRRLQRHSCGHEIRARFARHLSRQRASVRRFRPRSTSVFASLGRRGFKRRRRPRPSQTTPRHAPRCNQKPIHIKHTTTTPSMISSFVRTTPRRSLLSTLSRRFSPHPWRRTRCPSPPPPPALARTSLNANGIAAITNPRRRPRTPWPATPPVARPTSREASRFAAARRRVSRLRLRRRARRCPRRRRSSIRRPRARVGRARVVFVAFVVDFCRRRKRCRRRRDGVVALALIAPNDPVGVWTAARAAFESTAERRPWGRTRGHRRWCTSSTRGFAAGQRRWITVDLLDDARREHQSTGRAGGADAVVPADVRQVIARIVKLFDV